MPPRLLRFLPLLLVAAPAQAFDYLEHSYLSDRACREAQRKLARVLKPGDDSLAARYLALSLTCPEAWDRPYCLDGYKQVEGGLNRLEAPPAESGDHSITLGDFAALPDHLATFGAVRGLPQAAREGLTTRVLEWLATEGDAGGVISDVAEDACETPESIGWGWLEPLFREPTSPELPSSPLVRAPAKKVVSDPAGPYSFDNPQYLDLVLQNHSHFGPEAYRTWSGFHATARDLARTPCEQVIPHDADLFENLADDLAGFEEIDWDDLSELELEQKGCALVAERIRLRVVEWGRRASPELSEPVRSQIARLAAAPSPERDALASSLVMPLIGLVFEGAGLHFLQDGLSGGHVRLQRLAYELQDSRYHHDADSANGVPARVSTATGSEELVLFGDGYVLATPTPDASCDEDPAGLAPEQVTHCLILRQRKLLLTTTTASLLHWAETPDDGYVRRHLPVVAPGQPAPADAATAQIERGALPTPPPLFSYQSFLFSTSLDATGGPPQVGVRTVFLTELDARANWMTSYHFGLLTRLAQPDQAELTTEFSFMFHWRYAARFLINAGPYAFLGAGGFDERVTPFFGVGPNIGVSVLPEGWIRLPLEISLSYRVPFRLLDASLPLDQQRVRIDAHWVELAVGLAFM